MFVARQPYLLSFSVCMNLQEIEFCANLTPGGIKFTNFSENQLTTVCQEYG